MGNKIDWKMIKEGFRGDGEPKKVFWNVLARIISMMFWTWLVVGFIRFFLVWVFSITGVLLDDPYLAVQTIKEYTPVINILGFVAGLIYFISHFPLWKPTKLEGKKHGIRQKKAS